MENCKEAVFFIQHIMFNIRKAEVLDSKFLFKEFLNETFEIFDLPNRASYMSECTQIHTVVDPENSNIYIDIICRKRQDVVKLRSAIVENLKPKMMSESIVDRGV